MHTAYCPELESSSNFIVLNEEESHHLVKVLRHTIGQELQISNGKGQKSNAKIHLAHPKKCEVEILDSTYEAAPEKLLHLAIAPTKNMDRLEWLIEKSTEIGVDKITLLACKNNERKVVKMERLEKILLSAMKQSQRFYLPELEALTPFPTFIAKYSKGGIAHCYDTDATKASIGKWKVNGPILIGPEGDFTREEVEMAQSKGYATIDLGQNRLRTETAALFAISAMKLSSNQ